MPIITLANGKQFSAGVDESILDAALRAGIVLEHSCKTGRCGACKALPEQGESVATETELALTEDERSQGWILSCVRQACTDMTLDVDDLSDFPRHDIKTLPCRIQSIERLSVDVVRVLLRLPPNQRLGFSPGQYIDVIGKDGLRRSYSLANAPREDNQLELHIRQVVQGDMSRYWFDTAQANDLLRLNGPLGTFFLRDSTGVDLLLLATGTGMAPIKALLEGMLTLPAQAQPRSVSVYWGGRVPADIYWQLPALPLPLRFFPVLSRADADWAGLRGHVQDAVLSAGTDLSNAVVYACGSLAMIESARRQLVANGLDSRRFYSDAFVSSSHS